MAILLVTPAEVLKLINPYKTWGKTGFLIAAIANVLQATNFAFNFMLYCIVDRRFRIIVKDMFTFSCCTEKYEGQENELMVMPLKNGRAKMATSNKTLTLRVGKNSSKSSLHKKKVIMFI